MEGSANRDKARVKVARVHAGITDRRKDFLHKLTTRLVRDNQAVVTEDLSVRNLVRNHHLARAISDAARRQPRAMLAYKCQWYGRDLIVTGRYAAVNIRAAGLAVLACGAGVRPARNLPGQAAGRETGTPAGDRRSPRPSGRGEVNG